ncbi:MAG TPA: ATP-binding cassette domain-containing protein, partial [Candidatus Dormibacteraeota bacterium]|nr:ATP-binding cassette domain-containing protein [Candidatus Dormibacteraeota bacterium]
APSRGAVRVGARPLVDTARRLALPPSERRVALVRQRPGLFPHLTVAQNLAYGLRTPQDPATRALVGEVTEAMGLGELLGSRPGTLSGGQAQRVALARALLSRHDVLLLDEPFAGLDAALQAELLELCLATLRGSAAPAVLVSHDLVAAQRFGERIGILDQGRLLQLDAPDAVVARPASRRVAELVGYGGFLPEPGLPPGGGWIGVHPDRVAPGAVPARGPVLTGTVGACHPAGGAFTVTLAVEPGGKPVTCRLGAPAVPGTALTVTAIDPPRFDAGGLARPGPAQEYPRAG